ncbi:YceI family protein [Nocardiopsis gilva YIM 90087]|uniref:YceI family protein n=1 Tax=Nocardiopsis gilva YIM 90087 TaxID=1235441 RepID=A0A223S5I2_9ACTN|nr:YceI family protein [Nocardiopsis gilva]ASU83402.1 YceI family protein [Nocardiopsis gilva YIM 90087]
MTEFDLKPGTWKIDPTHSQIGFSVRHMMISRVRGRMEKFSSSLAVDDDPLASSVSATIDATSIDTDNGERDAHIRSADFFDVAAFPEWTFTSTGVRQDGAAFLLDGDLTIKGVTRPVELRMEFNGTSTDDFGFTRARFHAETELSRRTFGVDIEMPMDGGGMVVGDRVAVEIDAEFIYEPD